MKKSGLTISFLFFVLFAIGQGNGLMINLQPVFNSQKLVPGKMYFDPKTNDSLRIDVLQFYISGISFYRKDSLVYQEPNSFHLVDLNDSASLKLHCQFPNSIRYDKIKFNIGIDSTTNVAGVLGGDLDPTKGMYWTWQSGYINFKLEGYSPQCPARNHKFQYHLGGYQSPNASIQTLSFSADSKTKELKLEMNLNLFLNGMDLKKEYQIMSPGENAVRISKQIPGIFRLVK